MLKKGFQRNPTSGEIARTYSDLEVSVVIKDHDAMDYRIAYLGPFGLDFNEPFCIYG